VQNVKVGSEDRVETSVQTNKTDRITFRVNVVGNNSSSLRVYYLPTSWYTRSINSTIFARWQQQCDVSLSVFQQLITRLLPARYSCTAPTAGRIRRPCCACQPRPWHRTRPTPHWPAAPPPPPPPRRRRRPRTAASPDCRTASAGDNRPATVERYTTQQFHNH